MVGNINAKVSGLFIALYCVIVRIIQRQNPNFKGAEVIYNIQVAMVTIGCYIILYHYETVSKTNYIGKLKIDRLMAEQSKILDKIPEGSMIYRIKNVESSHRRAGMEGEDQG
jgi:hypothetical protein|tara:strand:- start:1565 stop:1900 length:336 start_codon:yes stop_codon:yes gene_type:complete